MTPALWSYLSGLPDRCPSCCWNPATQGHGPECGAGVELGDRGMAAASSTHKTDAATVDALIESFARSGVEFSVNDLRPKLVQVRSRNVIGARVNAALRRNRIHEVGRVRSSEPGTHGHKIGVYRGT